MKKYLPDAVVLVPVISTILAVSGYGFFFRATVPVSCAVILCLMPDRAISKKSIQLIIMAFIISIGGDWFMSHVGDKQVRFLYGICLFFVTHIGFLVFGLKNGRINWPVLCLLLTGFITFFFVVLMPAMKQVVLYIAVMMYLLVSCLSLSAATGLRLSRTIRWWFSLGIGLLVFSDTLIALKVFAGNYTLSGLILPTYFASLISITLALMQKPSHIGMNI